MSFRRGFGFLSLFFINPLIILLFQNFTIAKDITPVNSAQTSVKNSGRSPASFPSTESGLNLKEEPKVETSAPKRYESGLE